MFIPELNETYHSRNGALEESLHVFIKEGLTFYFNNNKNQSIVVFEMGFGTALNAMLSMQYAIKNNVNIHYIAIEKYPLEEGIIRKLNYLSHLDQSLMNHAEKIISSAFGSTQNICDNFTLTLINNDLQEVKLAELPPFDLIYFDAFAPDKQPELWSKNIFIKLFHQMNENGVFVTYSSKGQVKRDLKEVGFNVYRIPGPPYKRHMLRALKSNDQSN